MIIVITITTMAVVVVILRIIIELVYHADVNNVVILSFVISSE